MNHLSFAQVMRHVDRSIFAEQVFCSWVTQMNFLPQFANQPPLKIVHRENYETSYHRNTAAGNLHRLLANEWDEMLILMTVECFIEAKEHDKTAENALNQITASTPVDQKWIQTATYWHQQRKRHLKRAVKSLYATIGSEMWQKGVALAE